jgi:hypothetical protein
VDGNQRKIKGDKVDLMHAVEQAMAEMREQLSFSHFKTETKHGLEMQGEFDRLRNKEKELNLEIKKLTEDFKKA